MPLFYVYCPITILHTNFHVWTLEVMLYCHLQHYYDTIIKMQEDFFINIYLSLYCKGSKGLFKVCVWEGVGKTEQNCNILTPTLIAVNEVSFWVSWCSTGGPGVHSAGCWLSLLHLISNFSGSQTPSGFPRAPGPGVAFPTTLSSITPSPTVTGTVLTSVLT